MNMVIVVPGGITEMLQAAPVIATLSVDSAEPLLVVGSSAAAELSPAIPGDHHFVGVRGLGAHPGAFALTHLWVELRGRRLETAVLCTESAAVRATVYAAAIPRRIGCAGGLSDRLLSERVRSATGGSRAGRWLALADALGSTAELPGTEIVPPEAALRSAEQLLLSNGVGDGRLLVAIAPGQGFAEVEVGAWVPERYAHLANRLAARHGAGVVLVGDARDRRISDEMRLDMSADTVDLCGELDLVTAAAVIARCDLLISTDTPLLHVAAAVGTASVGLFGPTNGHARAPSGADHRVVQALPNGHSPATLDRIRVDDVLAGIESAL